MRVAIVGSRTFADKELVNRVVTRLAEKYDDLTIVSGGAQGADSLAALAGSVRDIELNIFPANWQRYGKSAGYRRNQTIVENADMVIAFFSPGGRSKGTTHTVNLAIEAGKKLHVYHEGRWTDR